MDSQRSFSVFWLLLILQRFFSDGGLTVVQPYSAEIWPMHLRATGMGLAFAAGNLGRMVGILSLALIAGSSGFVEPRATPPAIEPALLYLASWCFLCGLAFLFIAFETNRRSLEQIDGALHAPGTMNASED